MGRDDEKNYFERLLESEKQWVRTKPFPADHNGALAAPDGAQLQEGLEEFLNVCRLLAGVRPQPEEQLLDLGGGSGWIAKFSLRFGLTPVLADIALPMCRVARQTDNFAAAPFPIVNADSIRLPFITDHFDICVIAGALHHMVGTETILREVHRVLRPGGRIAVSEPGRGHSTAPGSVQARKRFGVTEKELPPDTLAAMLDAAGFRDIRIKPQLAHDFFLDPDGLTSLDKLSRLGAVEKAARELTGGGAVLELNRTFVANLNEVTNQHSLVIARA